MSLQDLTPMARVAVGGSFYHLREAGGALTALATPQGHPRGQVLQ